MILKEQLLDYNDIIPGHVYIFTANSLVSRNNLCMGGGAALAALNAYPGVDRLLGDLIRKKTFDQTYGYVEVPYKSFYVGAFQTKTCPSLRSNTMLVKRATKDLLEVIRQDTSSRLYHLNYPAIGLGGLKVEDVEAIIEELPDNVIVYK